MSHRVLIIDDDTAITDLLKLIFERETFEVVVAHSGEEGIAAAKKVDPSVIIIDLLLPAMDGWEICKNIRAFSQVPIMVWSALNTPGLASKALDAGADEFLTKPVPNAVLVAHVKRLARRAVAEKNSSALWRQW